MFIVFYMGMSLDVSNRFLVKISTKGIVVAMKLMQCCNFNGLGTESTCAKVVLNL